MELTMGLEDGAVRPRTEFEPFFLAHFERVARAAAFVAGDVATGQDLAQESFTRLHQRWRDLASDDHARNFVYKVAINLARSYLRKHGRVFLYGLRGPDPPVRSATDGADDWLAMRDALQALPPRQRACLVLVDYVDMSSVDAARVLGLSPNTVRVHLMRGRETLRAALVGTTEEGQP